ncbi:MAG: D-cysteine desulfhydrase family protein [Coriobacteriaceae bacterium]|nr:D-cysteine desulfhydrase family protein [Coriobacteriaceae bacterium]MDD7112020.1 D-cysteine desulfhydrase family protein [Coriobacteriaceae bacterium]
MPTYTVEEAKNLLARLPRTNLGFYPTPLHKLERLSAELGVNIYLKRDDLSGVSTFGGNKMRKLEYLLGDALAQGADTVFTYGATQSNHAMQTVAAACKCGLHPVLYLVSVVEPDKETLRANLLLDYIYGAEVHIVQMEPGEEEADAEARSFAMGAEHVERLRAEGKHPYDVPMGGASPVGSVGFAGGFVELKEQCASAGIKPDYLYHASGTGGTLAGLAAGRALLGADMRIVSVAVSPKDEGYEARTADLANRALGVIGASHDVRVSADDLQVERGYFAPGYEIPNEWGNAAIRRLARTEGVLMDTVYSGKAFGGLLDHIKRGLVPQGSTVVFWHTGGATALFSEPQIIGDLAQA